MSGKKTVDVAGMNYSFNDMTLFRTTLFQCYLNWNEFKMNHNNSFSLYLCFDFLVPQAESGLRGRIVGFCGGGAPPQLSEPNGHLPEAPSGRHQGAARAGRAMRMMMFHIPHNTLILLPKNIFFNQI